MYAHVAARETHVWSMAAIVTITMTARLVAATLISANEIRRLVVGMVAAQAVAQMYVTALTDHATSTPAIATMSVPVNMSATTITVAQKMILVTRVSSAAIHVVTMSVTVMQVVTVVHYLAPTALLTMQERS